MNRKNVIYFFACINKMYNFAITESDTKCVIMATINNIL